MEKKLGNNNLIDSKDIKKGEIYSINNLTVKRPGDGLSPMRWDDVLGSVAKRNFLADELIEL